MKIIIVYDQYNRDFQSLSLLAKNLKKKNLDIFLIPKSYLILFAYVLKPYCIIISNPDHHLGELSQLCSQNFKIYSIPTEQFFFNKKDFLDRIVKGHHYGSSTDFLDTNIDSIDQFFLWSNTHVRYCKNTKLSNKVTAIGSTKINRNKIKKKSKVKTIGFIIEEENPFNWINFLHSNKHSTWPFSPDIQLIHEVQTTFSQIKLLEILKKKKINIIIRIYWTDSVSDFKFMNSKNITIDNSKDTKNFFDKVDAVITSKSTMGFEAYLYNLPVISVRNLYKYKVIDDFPSHPCSPKTIRKAVETCLNLNKFKINNIFKKKIQNFFGYELDPARKIYEYILKTKNKPKSFKKINRVKEQFILNRLKFSEKFIYKYSNNSLINFIFLIKIKLVLFIYKKKFFN